MMKIIIDIPKKVYDQICDQNLDGIMATAIRCGKPLLKDTLPSAQPDLQEYSVWFCIGETLVDVSKMHITAEEGIEKIRSYLMRMKKPEREKGEWIYGEDEYGIDGYHCDKCGFFVPWNYAHNFINYIEEYKFCPNCGADMRGEENECMR